MGLADNTAPMASGNTPNEAIHNLHPLLYIVQDHGTQLHLEFGVSKCKLLILAKSNKLKQTESILIQDPDTLTFFYQPVTLVEPYYVHLGVPQAPRNQS